MLNKNYFESPREIKWCPGCGNYAILMAIQKTFYSLNIPNESTVFISGIGCSGRFPYYINTYGFHTLHGRAPAVATGLKLVRPDLNVWVVIGDGDGFSIGLSHVLHLLRRNINIKILFINNKTYSLTKGQYSPTSDKNSITKSSPFGTIEEPLNPILLALNVGTSFVARVIDTDIKKMEEIIIKAIKHKGTSFIEILQNCNIFNDGVYEKFSSKISKSETTLELNDKKELIFGSEQKYILVHDNFKLKIINFDSNEKIQNVLIHDMESENIIQIMLAKIGYNIPLPLGVFRAILKPCYEDIYYNKTLNAKKINKIIDIFI